MKKYILSVVFLCTLLGIINTSKISAQGFNSVSTTDGTNIIAVGNSGKIYRSANGGTTWVGFINGAVNQSCVTSYGTDVWIAANSGNVYKTLISASAITSYNIGSSTNLNSITFLNSNTGYACGDNGEVYKSVNGGVNWSLSNSGIASVKLNSVSFRNSNTGTVVGNNGTIYNTTDGGASWSLQSSGTTRNLLKVKYFNDSLAAVGEYGTLLLNNNGTWTSVATRINTDIRGVTGTSMNDIHVCGGGGFIRNNKNNNNKFLNFEVNPMLANLTDIFFYDGNKGWAVSSLNNVIIYTSNGGNSWSMPSGASVSYVWNSKVGASGNFLGNNICKHPTNRDVVFVAFTNQVYRSSDRGETYSAVGNVIPAGNTPHSLYINALDTNIWMVATESTPDKIYRSSNYGQNWTQVLGLNFSSYGQPLEEDQNNPHNYYFAPDGGGFYRSTNDGATFTEISGNYSFRSPCEIIVAWDSSDVILLGDGTTGSGRAVIFKSTNGGINWTPRDTVSTDGSETPSMCNTVFDNSIFWSTEWGGSDIYKSTDYGTNFSIHHSTGLQGWGSDMCREDPNMIITGSWTNAATMSLDGGNTWTPISGGLSGHGGGILALERGFVVAQQGSNVYKLAATYTYTPAINSIDVQALTIGNTGTQYFPTSTATLTGTVINNNAGSSATFTVTRKITPGNYTSTKNISNLLPNNSSVVTFDPWTFNSGTTYTIKDSVYISGDVVPGNDVLTGTITPYVGEVVIRVNETFVGSFPPANWTFQFTGTNYWLYSTNSAYSNGVGCAEYNYYNAQASSGSKYLISPTFPIASIAGDSLKYDWAYAPFNASSRDSLIIETSTNGGSSYSTLVRLFGYSGDTLVSPIYALSTRATYGQEYVNPIASEWRTKKWALPVNTNKVRFRARSGFGNNLFIDNINVSSGSLYTQYNIKLAPEGMYDGSVLAMRDTVKAYLRSTVTPFNKIDSAIEVIDSLTLNAPFVFKNATTGTYYIQILHRNALETWSRLNGDPITKGVTANYDFTSAQNKAYGDNMILVGSKWCFYSGDVSDDGSIDITDVIDIYNDIIAGNYGYLKTDLNADETIDVTDLLIAYNNSINVIYKATPESAPADVQNKKTERIKRLNEFRKMILQK